MEIKAEGRLGSIVWVLPEDAVSRLNALAPPVRAAVTKNIADYMRVFCHAVLRTFGDKAYGQLLHMTMVELLEAVNRRKE